MSPALSSQDIWSAYAATAERIPLPLSAVAARLPDPADIAPREWLYGTRLIRRFVSVLAAPGGVGKSAWGLGCALAVATGRGFLGEPVHHSVPAWVFNLEDPLAESERRLAALMQFHAIPREAAVGRLFLHSGRTRRLNMAESGEGGIAHPDRQAVIEACLEHGIGLVVVDPFVKSHRLDENSNADMDAAATAWAEIAEATGAAILLIHHVRKTANGTIDVESTRGAKSLTDAARSAFLLVPMSPEEAKDLSVPAVERWRYIRLDDGKANLAPRPAGARWFRLETVALNNATPDYPAGDQVAAVAAWKPPSPWRGLEAADINRALDLIAAGTGDGLAFSAHRGGRARSNPGEQRWVGRVLIDAFDRDEADAVRIIAAWLKSGLLTETPFRDPTQRKQRMGIRVDDSKRPSFTPHTGDSA